MRELLLLISCVFFMNAYAQDYRYGKVSQEELEEQFNPQDSSAAATYLYNKRRTYYSYSKNRGFQVITEVQQRIKIYNEDGFKKGTQEIPFYKPSKGPKENVVIQKAATYNFYQGEIYQIKVPKDKIFEERLSKNIAQKKIAFPNLRKGSVLEISYKLTSPYEFYIDDLQFQYDVPVKKLECSVEIPEFYNFKQQSKGYYVLSSKNSTGGRSITWIPGRDRGTSVRSYKSVKLDYRINIEKYEADNIPALKDDEPYVFNMDNYRGGMTYEINYVRYPNSAPQIISSTWSDVARNIYSSVGFQIEKRKYYESAINPVIEQSKNDIEKIVNIFQLVKEKVKWNGYSSVYPDKDLKKGFEEGTGNVAVINLMLVSMLRTAGLDANPVLVSTRSNGVPFFPTRTGFNYVIAAVSLEDGMILMDASEPFSLPNMLPQRAINWQGRLIMAEGNSRWINLNLGSKAIEDTFISAMLDTDGNLSGTLRFKFSNLGALNFRNLLGSIKEEDLIGNLEDENSIEIEEYKIANQFKLGKPITLSAKFSSEDLIETINDKTYIRPLLFRGYFTNPLKLEERKYPIEFDSPWKKKNTVTIIIPEGYSIESSPQTTAFALPDNMGIFKYQVLTSGSTIKVTSVLEFNRNTIPANYYEILKGFFGEVVSKQTEKIVLVKS